MNISGLLYINKSAMNANQNNLDITSNNIANVNTVGFKAKSGSFQTLMNNQITNDEVRIKDNQQVGVNIGVKNTLGETDYKQGSMQQTSIPTDYAIKNDGFFGVIGQDGKLMLTRAGNFKRDENNNLVTTNGLKIQVTNNTPNVYKPNSIADLQAIGNNFYQVTNPGNLQVDNTGNNVSQGFLENSNVDLASQMVEMITTQRAYQMNAKALQATDSILNTTNNFNQ